jgi:glycosyltransferase involved in cell wall biosynthesis
MRIPFEGMLTASALRRFSDTRPRFLISIWGNDFTLHAAANPWMGALTRSVLRTANALHTDCQRDQRLAGEWGFDLEKPALVLPGAGGIQLDVFQPPVEPNDRQGPVVINPRGFRAYVRNDTFFKAIPLVLREFPEVRFVCPTMQGVVQAERWVDELGIRSAVTLLPQLTRHAMAAWFRQAWVAVSPATHDGTPNTLLEAMACGCFPVAGDLESIREWISEGENGFLVDPSDPNDLANAVLRALRDETLRREASRRNRELILQKAEYGSVMQKAEAFYESLL